MYVDAVDQCNELAFTLGPSTSEEVAASGVLAASVRSWNIKVCKNIFVFFRDGLNILKNTKIAQFLFPVVIFRSPNMTVTITI